MGRKKTEKISGKVVVGGFSGRFLFNPKKPIKTLALRIPLKNSTAPEVFSFLEKCQQKKKHLILRSVFMASDVIDLVFVKKEDLKNINEDKLRSESFWKDYIPGAEK